MASLRPIPHLTLSSPMNEHELRRLMFTAQQEGQGPFVIRYPRGRGVMVDWRCPLEAVPVGRGRCLTEGSQVAVLSIGPVGNAVQNVVRRLAAQGYSIAHYDMRFLKPIDEEILSHVGRHFQRILTVEDGSVRGGLGSAVLEYMADHNLHPLVRRLGLPDEFVEHGTPDELRHLVGIDEEGIEKSIKSLTQDPLPTSPRGGEASKSLNPSPSGNCPLVAEQLGRALPDGGQKAGRGA